MTAFLVFFKLYHTLDLEILQDIVDQLGIPFVSLLLSKVQLLHQLHFVLETGGLDEHIDLLRNCNLTGVLIFTLDVNTTVRRVINVLSSKLRLLPHILRVDLTLPHHHVLRLAHEHLLLGTHVLSHLPLLVLAEVLRLVKLGGEVGLRKHWHLH